jgi:UDP-N-acetylmuramate dehydrogenase
MNERQRTTLLELIPEGMIFDCPMAKLTTFKVGGNAEAICFPRDLSQLGRIVSYFYKECIPYRVVGKGSNLLVSDRGIKGAVIILKERLASIDDMGGANPLILAGGGATIAGLVTYCKRNGISGLEFMAGIPGTLGGAVFMNAGAYGQEIGNVVREVLIMHCDGESEGIDQKDMGFSYRRSSAPKGAVIYGAKLALKRDSKRIIAERIFSNLKKRKETQPLDYPSAGSVFRNPPNDSAGKLIEMAGLKGMKAGGAMISPKHGNFIVNTGGARSGDILALIDLAKGRVKAETGIDLETEIVILGD